MSSGFCGLEMMAASNIVVSVTGQAARTTVLKEDDQRPTRAIRLRMSDSNAGAARPSPDLVTLFADD